MYRIDIKSNSENAFFYNRLLKLLVTTYILAAAAYLLYKLFTLTQQHTSSKEWMALFINLAIIIFLTLQLLKTNTKKYILITDEFVKYRYRVPWATQLEWRKIKSIHLGYSSVRFISKTGRKFRFYFSNATDLEKINLRETLMTVAQKQNIELMQPL